MNQIWPILIANRNNCVCRNSILPQRFCQHCPRAGAVKSRPPGVGVAELRFALPESSSQRKVEAAGGSAWRAGGQVRRWRCLWWGEPQTALLGAASGKCGSISNQRRFQCGPRRGWVLWQSVNWVSDSRGQPAPRQRGITTEVLVIGISPPENRCVVVFYDTDHQGRTSEHTDGDILLFIFR